MNCEACSLSVAANTGKVAAINASHGEICGCEAYNVSKFSPGLVSDDETLHFLVQTPQGRAENGYLNPSLLVQVDVDGLSVLRHQASDKEFEHTVSELNLRWIQNNKALEGIMSFPVSSVRYLEDQRFCCVYDTALELKPWHADLMMPELTVNAEPLSNTERKRRVRQRLKKLVDCIGNNFEDMVTFRNGALKHLS